MATFTVSIDTDNAAFGDDPEWELAHILREQIVEPFMEGLPVGVERVALRDQNGNTVGSFGWAE